MLPQITHNDFPIPKLPPPPPPFRAPSEGRLLSPLPSSPLEHSDEADKENAPAAPPATQPQQEPQALEPGQLPQQIADILAEINRQLLTFPTHPPHTVQRLAELVLTPRRHYRALASYLHAVDRVIQVTSGTNKYPLPPAVLDVSATEDGADDSKDPAASVNWGNPANASVGSDEALGGALLTPIPWLTRRSPESNGNGTTNGAQIHSEGTETISGPNGMGSVETVSVSVNGVPSMGHSRGVTQGELLRQEQRAGLVPVSQLARNAELAAEATHDAEDDDEHHHHHRNHDAEEEEEHVPEEEDAVPHARGPEEIGVGDTGPQGDTTSYMGEGGVSMRAIDVEAAVGRKHGEDATESGDRASDEDQSGGSVAGTKREAEPSAEGEPTKKMKEGDAAEPEAESETDTETENGTGSATKDEEDDYLMVTEDNVPAAKEIADEDYMVITSGGDEATEGDQKAEEKSQDE